MYGNYGFCLEWDELDEDLKRRKVEDYIAYHKKQGFCEEMSEAQAWEHICARFPIYF